MDNASEASEVAVVPVAHGRFGGLRRRVAIVVGSVGSLMAVPVAAFAEEPVPLDIAGTMSSALGDVTSNIGPTATIGLSIGGTILAFVIGWRLVKRFAK